jgi:hypothetical protein
MQKQGPEAHCLHSLQLATLNGLALPRSLAGLHVNSDKLPAMATLQPSRSVAGGYLVRAIVELEVSTDNLTFDALENYLLSDLPAGVDIREVNPDDPTLFAMEWSAAILSVSSTASLKVIKDLLVAFLESRKCKIEVKTKKGISVRFEGPVSDKQEVLDILDEITAAKSPE